LAIRSDDKNGNARDAPSDKVVVLLELTSTGIALHDHLVEVEGDATTP